MTTQQIRLTSLTPWIIGAIATAAIAVGSVLGFRALNEQTPANAEAAASPQSAQSDANTQSNNAPQSATPTPVSVPKPTPPPNLYAGGDEGVAATAEYFTDLWAYSLNMGDTDEIMKICHNNDFCTALDNDVHTLHADRIMTRPVRMKYLTTMEIWNCNDQRDGTKGTCIKFRYSQQSGYAIRKDHDATNPDYSTVSFSSSSEETVDYYEAVMLLVPEGDTWAIKHLRSDKK